MKFSLPIGSHVNENEKKNHRNSKIQNFEKKKKKKKEKEKKKRSQTEDMVESYLPQNLALIGLMVSEITHLRTTDGRRRPTQGIGSADTVNYS